MNINLLTNITNVVLFRNTINLYEVDESGNLFTKDVVLLYRTNLTL